MHADLKKALRPVLAAVLAGILLGYVAPDFSKNLKWLGDAFIALIRMVIAPVIFCTIVHGIVAMGDLKKVGRVGLKALIYFEVVSTFTLLVGAVVGMVIQPGAGFGADPGTLDPAAVAGFVNAAAKDTLTAHILGLISKSFFSALAEGELLQVLLVAILTGVAMAGMGDKAEKITHAIDAAGHIFFRVVGLVVKLAPIGAFGAMALTLDEIRRDLARLAMVREQIGMIEQARLDRIERVPDAGPNAMVRLLASIVDVGVETADMLVRRCCPATCATGGQWHAMPG